VCVCACVCVRVPSRRELNLRGPLVILVCVCVCVCLCVHQTLLMCDTLFRIRDFTQRRKYVDLVESVSALAGSGGCACVRACVCVCVRAGMRACVCVSGTSRRGEHVDLAESVSALPCHAALLSVCVCVSVSVCVHTVPLTRRHACIPRCTTQSRAPPILHTSSPHPTSSTHTGAPPYRATPHLGGAPRQVKGKGGKVCVLSSLHVTGERLHQLGGVAAMLRFPLEIDAEEEEPPVEVCVYLMCVYVCVCVAREGCAPGATLRS
jgi:eRF1 domain 3